MPKIARIARLGQAVSEFHSFPDGAVVDDVVAHFNEKVAKGETLAIDGDPVEGDYDFEDESTVHIVASTTGA